MRDNWLRRREQKVRCKKCVTADTLSYRCHPCQEEITCRRPEMQDTAEMPVTSPRREEEITCITTPQQEEICTYRDPIEMKGDEGDTGRDEGISDVEALARCLQFDCEECGWALRESLEHDCDSCGQGIFIEDVVALFPSITSKRKGQVVRKMVKKAHLKLEDSTGNKVQDMW